MKITPRRVVLATAGLAAAGVLLFGRGSTPDAGVAVPATAVSAQPTVDTSTAPAASPRPSTRAGSAAGTTGAEHGDGGDDSVDTPIIGEPTTPPNITETATQFAAAWLNTLGKTPQQWRAGLTPRVTTDVADDLADADPQSVPASARVGTVTATLQESLHGADVAVTTTDATPKLIGTLRLTLIGQSNGSYLVSDIDWNPAR